MLLFHSKPEIPLKFSSFARELDLSYISRIYRSWVLSIKVNSFGDVQAPVSYSCKMIFFHNFETLLIILRHCWLSWDNFDNFESCRNEIKWFWLLKKLIFTILQSLIIFIIVSPYFISANPKCSNSELWVLSISRILCFTWHYRK